MLQLSNSWPLSVDAAGGVGDPPPAEATPDQHQHGSAARGCLG